MTDPRHSSCITYAQSDLVYMGLLKNMCGVKRMYEMESQFHEETCIDTLRIIVDGTGLFYFKENMILNTLTAGIQMR
jgi:hypothetical protein